MKLKFLDRFEFPVLLAGLVIAGGLWGFEELMEVARDTPARLRHRNPARLPRGGQTADPPIGPPWLEGAVRDITSLGSTSRAGADHGGGDRLSLLIRRPATALLIFVAVAGGQVLSSLLKARHRPAAARARFASGQRDVAVLSERPRHAVGGDLSDARLAGGALPAGRATKIYVLSLAVLTTLLVGVSRIYLGVHWPSDVLAGWCAGFAWAMLCWLAARSATAQDGGAAKAGLETDVQARHQISLLISHVRSLPAGKPSTASMPKS